MNVGDLELNVEAMILHWDGLSVAAPLELDRVYAAGANRFRDGMRISKETYQGLYRWQRLPDHPIGTVVTARLSTQYPDLDPGLLVRGMVVLPGVIVHRDPAAKRLPYWPEPWVITELFGGHRVTGHRTRRSAVRYLWRRYGRPRGGVSPALPIALGSLAVSLGMARAESGGEVHS